MDKFIDFNGSQRDPDFVGLAAEIVGAYVTKNSIPASELPGFIAATHTALVKLTAPPAPEVEKPTPPVPIRRTITPDYLISLEDGRQYKSLKRHLTSRGLTPDDYRKKWGLPHDYPMVAANYAAQRSELARNSGLGQIRRNRAAAARLAAGNSGTEDKAPARRGRPKKVAAAAV